MEKLKLSLKLLPDVYLFVLIIFIKTLSANVAMKLVYQSTFYTLFGILGSSLIFASILSLFKFKTRYIAFYIFDFLISLILLTDIVYNRYFLDVTSAALIKQAGLVGEVKDSVFALLKPWDLFYFVDFIFISLFYKYFKRNLV